MDDYGADNDHRCGSGVPARRDAGVGDSEVRHRHERGAVDTEDGVEDFMGTAGEGVDLVATFSDRSGLLLLDRHDRTLRTATDSSTSGTGTFPKRA